MFAKVKLFVRRAVIALVVLSVATVSAVGVFSHLSTVGDAQAVAAEAPEVDPLALAKIDMSTGTLIVIAASGETQTVKIDAQSRVYLVKAPAKR